MKKIVENLTGGFTPSARVVDGTLILSLPDALSPVVWRLELGQIKASALEVRPNEKDGYILVLKTPKGDVHEIAPYDSKSKAVQALMVVGRAMEHAHGQLRPDAANNRGGVPAVIPQPTAPQKRQASAGRWITGMIAVVVLVAMIGLLVNLGPRQARLDFQAAGNSAAGTATTVAAPGSSGQTGVPVSADAFLQGR